MHKPVAAEHNRANLLLVVQLLDGIEYFPFFGTLLGLVRGGDIIPNDDDIDFEVNIDDRDELIQRLDGSQLHVDLNRVENQSGYFLQATRELGGEQTFVDFYFYSNDEKAAHIVDRWNFSGQWKNVLHRLHIPKDIVFPLQSAAFFGVGIPMPVAPHQCCEFLYGPGWQVPAAKGSGYQTLIFRNRPLVLARTRWNAFVARLLNRINKYWTKLVGPAR